MSQVQVDTMSHLVLQIYLGLTGKKQLYHINVTTVTGQHEGTLAILKRQNEKVLTTCSYYSYTHTSRTMLKLKPFFQRLGKTGERLCTHCSCMHSGNLDATPLH